MVISKCVPMQISRKRFSLFEKNHDPQGMVFVGWKYADEQKTKKINVQLHYDHIKEDIEEWIKANGGFGGGTVPPESDLPLSSNPDITPVGVTASEANYHDISVAAFDEYNDVSPAVIWVIDDEGNERPKRASLENPLYSDADSSIIDLKNKKGFIEINGGGTYVSENIYTLNPAKGSVTNIVVDNTGRNRKEGETPEEWEIARQPVEDFTLYYGVGGDFFEILTVPAWCRGCVQILHTTKSDLILTQSYSLVNHNYIADVAFTEPGEDDGYVLGEIISKDENKIYINMKNEAGFIEVDVSTENYKEYTFVFDNTELGSMTYIVVDNENATSGNNVWVNYGKTYKKLDDARTEIIESGVCEVESGEKAIIQVFHSLSMDIIVNVNKM